jgi:hypothetical protein
MDGSSSTGSSTGVVSRPIKINAYDFKSSAKKGAQDAGEPPRVGRRGAEKPGDASSSLVSSPSSSRVCSSKSRSVGESASDAHSCSEPTLYAAQRMYKQRGYSSESRDDDDAQSQSSGDYDQEARSPLEPFCRPVAHPKAADYLSTGDDEDNVTPLKIMPPKPSLNDGYVYDHARDFEGKGRYAEAAKHYQAAAEAGHHEAQVRMAEIYANGSHRKKRDKTQECYWRQRAESGRKPVLEVLTAAMPSHVSSALGSLLAMEQISPILKCAAHMVWEGTLTPVDFFDADNTKHGVELSGGRSENLSTSDEPLQFQLLEKITLVVMDYVYQNGGKPYKTAPDKSRYFGAIKHSRQYEARGITDDANLIRGRMNRVFSDTQHANDWKKKRLVCMALELFLFGDSARKIFMEFYRREWEYFEKVLDDCASLVKKKEEKGVVFSTADVAKRSHPWNEFGITSGSMASAVINRAACSVFGDIRGLGHEREITDAITVLADGIERCWGEEFENAAHAEHLVSNLVALYLPCFAFGPSKYNRPRLYSFWMISHSNIDEHLGLVSKKLKKEREDASVT